MTALLELAATARRPPVPENAVFGIFWRAARRRRRNSTVKMRIAGIPLRLIDGLVKNMPNSFVVIVKRFNLRPIER